MWDRLQPVCRAKARPTSFRDRLERLCRVQPAKAAAEDEDAGVLAHFFSCGTGFSPSVGLKPDPHLFAIALSVFAACSPPKPPPRMRTRGCSLISSHVGR